VNHFAVKLDFTLIRNGRARQALDQARLAGAVVADHRQDLTGAQFEVGTVQRGHLAVALYQALGLHHDRDCVH